MTDKYFKFTFLHFAKIIGAMIFFKVNRVNRKKNFNMAHFD